MTPFSISTAPGDATWGGGTVKGTGMRVLPSVMSMMLI